jgi:hypothetical protein
MNRSYISAAAGVTASAALAAAGLAAPALASSHHSPAVRTLSHATVMYDVGVHHLTRPASTLAAGTQVRTVPVWTGHAQDGTRTFTYHMVGKKPFVKQASATTTVKTAVVPVVLHFDAADGGGVSDPTLTNTCSRTKSPTDQLIASPLFQTKAYTWGPTKIGTGQFTSMFQRAEFWKYTKPHSVNPGYQVSLDPTVLSPVTVTVPMGDSVDFGPQPCASGSGTIGVHGVEIGWWESYLQTTLLPQLQTLGYGPRTLPIFLTEDVVWYITNPNNCCVLGYHNAMQPAATSIQTYSSIMYDDIKVFHGTADISVASHEIAEWMDDPFGNNPTKKWGNIGQVQGACQSNLEVGDPLSGTLQNTNDGTRVWHPQELAFASWFYHRRPSVAVNGWYSSHGTFKAPAKPCV